MHCIILETLESHNKILKLVLRGINGTGLTLNLEKCSFRISTPLRELLLKDRVWIWDESQDRAFKAIKSIIGENSGLARFTVELELILSTDASQIGLVATLYQVNT